MTTGAILRARQQRKQGIPEVQRDLMALISSDFKNALQETESGAWNYNLCYRLEREGALAIFKRLKDFPHYLFQMLIDVTAVDWLDEKEKRFDVVYQLLSIKHGHRIMLKIAVDEEDCWVHSLRPLWAAANFLEREVWDMFGIEFKGHGDLRRILMYDEFVGHPLRKDYPLKGKQPRIPLRIPEIENTSADMTRGDLVSLPSRGVKFRRVDDGLSNEG